MGSKPLQLEGEKAPVVCICGRLYTHCLACGCKNPYVLKKRSAELSFQLGYRVWVFSCNQCPTQTHTGMECKAPKLDTGEGFEYVRASRPKPIPEQPLTGDAVLGSDEHLALMNDWIIEKQSKHGWDAIRVYVEAQKAGWHLEAFGDRLEDDVKQTLIERGLLPNEPKKYDKLLEQDQIGSTESAVSLDDIIKNLQEDSK